MTQFNTYQDFLNSTYASWIPTYIESFDSEPTQELLDSPCTFVAYTDYGGDFLDRVTSQFLLEFAPLDSIISQSTIFFGMNLLYIGVHADTEDYPLSSYPDINKDFESYYCEKENEAEYESFKFFVEDAFRNKPRLQKWALNLLMQERSGCYSPQPDGTVDFCSSDLLDWIKSQPRKISA